MYIISRLIFISMITLVTACAGFPKMNNLKGNYSPTGEDVIIVMGVSPRYRIGVQPGHFKEEKWERDEMKFLALNIYPESGYIVAKLKPLSQRGAYAIDQVLPEGIGGFTPRFVACNGTQMVTFNSKQGKVLYVGDFIFDVSQDSLSYEYENKFEQAKELSVIKLNI